MNERASHTGFLCFVGTTAAFLVGLHQLGGVEGLAIDWSNPVEWVDESATESVVGATLRSIGLVIGYWLLTTTALCAITGPRGRRRRPRWVSILTLPGVRKMVDRTLATALAASIVATPLSPVLASAEMVAPPAVVFDASDGIPVPHVTSTAATAAPAAVGNENPTPNQATTSLRLHPVPVTATAAGPTVPASVVGTLARPHTVTRGDNLWSIASDRLEMVLGAEPSPGVVTEYWRLLIETNRGTLRSGDPNLIFPGELIDLPDVELEQ